MGQQGTVWTRTAKDRKSWRTLAEGNFLQWKDSLEQTVGIKTRTIYLKITYCSFCLFFFFKIFNYIYMILKKKTIQGFLNNHLHLVPIFTN